MKITRFLSPDNILLDLKSESKKKAIEEMVNFLVAGKILAARSKKEIIKQILKRESLGSTGIGQGIALPHCRTDKVKEVILLFANAKGLEFNSLDGEPVTVLFFLLSPSSDDPGDRKVQESLELLSAITRLLKDRFFRQALAEAKKPEDVLKIIGEEEG